MKKVDDSLKKFAQIKACYEKLFFENFPEQGLLMGKKDVALDRFTDYSLESVKRWHEKEDQFLKQLQSIKLKTLLGTPDYYTYMLLKETLRNHKNSRICQETLWNINPVDGWHNTLAKVAEKQPIGTPALRKKALMRWQSFPQVVDQQIHNLKIGMQQGYIAPKAAVKKVITQLKLMVDNEIKNSPYYHFAMRDKDKNFQLKVAELVKNQINPAIEGFICFLEKDYLPKARDTIALSALPSGSKCYQVKIKQYTTLNKTPKVIHALGLNILQKLVKKIRQFGEKRYGVSDIAEIFQLAKNESTGDFKSPQDILDFNFAALERIKAKALQIFDTLPKTPATLKPYPLHRAKTGASGEYHLPSEDGHSPGIFYINTYQPEKRSWLDMEAVLFHELIPGHHLQLALQQEDESISNLNLCFANSGYIEGWGLYAEGLAKELGAYRNEITCLGSLSNEALRASRLVVDTGIHVMDWSRQQAIDYLSKYTALDSRIIEGEVDRYIMLPGQATSYMLGKFEIEQLRHLAEKQLKENFDIREFHRQILKNGAVTLTMLRRQIKDWLNRIKKNI